MGMTDRVAMFGNSKFTSLTSTSYLTYHHGLYEKFITISRMGPFFILRRLRMFGRIDESSCGVNKVMTTMYTV